MRDFLVVARLSIKKFSSLELLSPFCGGFIMIFGITNTIL